MQKKLILFIIALLFSSSVILFYSSKHYSASEGNGWWAISFEEPKGENLNFFIENNEKMDSDVVKMGSKNFHWELLNNKEKIQEGNVYVGVGRKEKIEIDKEKIKQPASRVSIKVIRSSSDETSDFKEIYKNL